MTDTILDPGLWEAGLAGVSPAKQRRSRETEARLIAAGRTLLRSRALDGLSVEDLCAEAGCTIGAFYKRFDSKEAFFAAVQFVICRDRDMELARLVARAAAERWGVTTICAALVADLVDWYRANVGVLRASLQHARQGESAWSPIKETGARHKAVWTTLLGPHLRPPDAGRDDRVAFANQVVNGTLVHMVLIDPGPVRLDDPATVTELTRVLTAFLTG